jgi:hypothetical protein
MTLPPGTVLLMLAWALAAGIALGTLAAFVTKALGLP